MAIPGVRTFRPLGKERACGQAGAKKREKEGNERSTALSGLPAYISRVCPSCQKSRLIRAMNGFSGARSAAGGGGGSAAAALLLLLLQMRRIEKSR